MPRHLLRLVAAVALTAAASLAAPATPALAAGCSSASGVTVVVDFHELGGGVQSACDAKGGGEAASAIFPESGFTLKYVQRQPGFVCRVSDKPLSDQCVNTPPSDAYWGLWWSDGKSGTWKYASTGAGSLVVPEGGYVAFSWNDSSTASKPGYTPTAHASPSPSPTASATPSPSSPPRSPHPGGTPPGGPAPTSAPTTSTGSPGSTGSTGSAGSADSTAASSPTPGPGATSSPARRAGRGASVTATPTTKSARDRASPAAPARPRAAASPSTQPVAAATSDPTDPSGGLPAWVAPVAIAVLFGAAGTVAVLRRRGAGHGIDGGAGGTGAA